MKKSLRGFESSSICKRSQRSKFWHKSLILVNDGLSVWISRSDGSLRHAVKNVNIPLAKFPLFGVEKWFLFLGKNRKRKSLNFLRNFDSVIHFWEQSVVGDVLCSLKKCMIVSIFQHFRLDILWMCLCRKASFNKNVIDFFWPSVFQWCWRVSVAIFPLIWRSFC